MPGELQAEQILAELSGVAVIVLNERGAIVCANPAACRLFELPGENIERLWRPQEEQRQYYFCCYLKSPEAMAPDHNSSFVERDASREASRSLTGNSLQVGENCACGKNIASPAGANIHRLAGELETARTYGRRRTGFWCVSSSGKKFWPELDISFSNDIAGGDGRGNGLFYVVARDRTHEVKKEELRQTQLELATLLASASSLDDCAPSVLHLIAAIAGWNYAALWIPAFPAGDEMANIAVWSSEPERFYDFIHASRTRRAPPGECLVGRAWQDRRLIWSANSGELCSVRREAAIKANLRSFLAIPIIYNQQILAIVELAGAEIIEPDQAVLAVLAAVDQQLSQFIRRKNLEQQIAEQQQMTAQIVQSANDIFVAVDSDGNVMEWNQQAEYTLGWSKEEVLGRQIAELIIPARFRPEHFAGMSRALVGDNGPMLNGVNRVQALTKDGREIPVSIALFQINVGAKNVFCAFMQDLEEKMLVDAALEHSEEMFRLLVETVQDYAIVLLDSKGRFASWNVGAERLRGYSAEEVLGKYYGISFSQSEVDLGLPEKLLQKAREMGRAEDIGWRLKRDGTPYLVESTITALRSTDGSLKGFAKISRDITEVKKVEEELRIARDRALEASNAKSAFLANMSHEIRTPLNGILGISEMLLKTPLTERQFSFAQTINEAGKSLLSVINDILDFSRIEAGKFVLDIHEFEPREMLQSVLDLLGSQAQQKKLSMSYIVDPEIPLRLMGDSMRLRQVLLNFVSNAIKFSEKGEIVISASLEGWHEHVARLRFSVTDQGIGIGVEKQASLFQPFVQIDASSTRRHGGSGLGLSICKRLAELMGADVGVTSEEGSGSTFWMRVDLGLPSHYREESSSTKSEPVDLDDDRAAEALRGSRILLITDQLSDREFIASNLISWGAEMHSVGSVAAGLDALRIANLAQNPFQVCIVDLALPLHVGMELGKLLVADSSVRSAGLMIVLPPEIEGASQEAVSAGFDYVLHRPINSGYLLHALVKLVTRPARAVPSKSEDGDTTTLTLRAIKPHVALVVEPSAVTQQVVVLSLQDLGFEAIAASSPAEAARLIKEWYFSILIYDCHMEEANPFALVKSIRRSEADKLSRMPIVGMTDDPALQAEGKMAGIDNFIDLPVDPEQLRKLVQHYRPDSES